MAEAHVAITRGGSAQGRGLPMPVADSRAGWGETITDGLSTLAAPPGANQIAVVTCLEGPARVRFGPNLAEQSDQHISASIWWVVLAGQTREFSINAGDYVEVQDPE
jgi:hypothetical protein